MRSAGVDGVDDKATLDIIDAHIRYAFNIVIMSNRKTHSNSTVFRTAQRGPTDAASGLVAALLPLDPRQSSPNVDNRMDTLRERLMLVLTRDFVAVS